MTSFHEINYVVRILVANCKMFKKNRKGGREEGKKPDNYCMIFLCNNKRENSVDLVNSWPDMIEEKINKLEN